MKMNHQTSEVKLVEPKLIVITRQDIDPGYQVVQSTHSIADFAHTHPEVFVKWKQESNSIICLSAKSQEHLLNLHQKYSQRTESSIFFEPDVDEFTSLCLYGTPEVRRSLSHLPLTLKNKQTI